MDYVSRDPMFLALMLKKYYFFKLKKRESIGYGYLKFTFASPNFELLLFGHFFAVFKYNNSEFGSFDV